VASLRLGDFREPGFAGRLERYPQAARAAGIFHDKAGKRSSLGRCGECAFLERCSVCPASIGHIPGNDDPGRVPDFPCAFNRVALGYQERFPPPDQVVAGRVLGTLRRRIPNRASRW
jgi:hypothetical protein